MEDRFKPGLGRSVLPGFFRPHCLLFYPTVSFLTTVKERPNVSSSLFKLERFGFPFSDNILYMVSLFNFDSRAAFAKPTAVATSRSASIKSSWESSFNASFRFPGPAAYLTGRLYNQQLPLCFLLVIFPKGLCLFDVFFLRTFVSATEQQDNLLSIQAIIDPVPGAEMYS